MAPACKKPTSGRRWNARATVTVRRPQPFSFSFLRKKRCCGADTEAELCEGFPQGVSYRVIEGTSECWHFRRLPGTFNLDSTTASSMFYDGGQEEPQAASTVRPEEEENSFLDRAPPAFLMWGLLALVFSWGSIYMGRWLLPRARQGAVQIRNFFCDGATAIWQRPDRRGPRHLKSRICR